jgi:sulfite reductase alpha subunit-like flavoprotein
MVLELLRGSAAPERNEIWLLMGSPYTTDLLYHELFLELAQEFPNFHYLQALSREPRPDGSRGSYVDALLKQHRERLGPVLADGRTVLYLCGLIGLQFNVFQRLATLGLLGGYAVVGGQLADRDLKAWTPQDMKRSVKPTERCMIEVY